VKVYGNNSHGGHAQYMCVPANTLVPLDDALSFTAGAAISCGTGTAYGALRRMNVSGNDTLAIFGQGPVGLSATQLAAAMGARVIALDISPQRLERAQARRQMVRAQEPGLCQALTDCFKVEFHQS
jgi:D-arabinose 1-dehydrogenase-like Zn-dependent alcohol dehydrogenase